MHSSVIRHADWPSLSVLAGVLLFATLFAACGTTGNGGSNSIKLDATAVDTFFGAFSFSYPAGWYAPLRDVPAGAHTAGWLEFVPPGESSTDVYVLYSRGYEGLSTFWCDLTVTLDAGQSFNSWADCVVNAMEQNGSFADVSHRQANGGKVQTIEARQGDRQLMWGFIYARSVTGTVTIGALTFNATPAKFTQFRPYADAMISSFRSKS